MPAANSNLRGDESGVSHGGRVGRDCGGAHPGQDVSADFWSAAWVSCASASGCTAVGGTTTADGQGQALAERWNGHSWAIQRAVWEQSTRTSVLWGLVPVGYSVYEALVKVFLDLFTDGVDHFQKAPGLVVGGDPTDATIPSAAAPSAGRSDSRLTLLFRSSMACAGRPPSRALAVGRLRSSADPPIPAAAGECLVANPIAGRRAVADECDRVPRRASCMQRFRREDRGGCFTPEGVTFDAVAASHRRRARQGPTRDGCYHAAARPCSPLASVTQRSSQSIAG